MISFSRPELKDRAQLQPIFFNSTYHGCEYSFTNICIWGQQQFALIDGQIVLFSHWDGRSMYVYPGTKNLDQLVPLLRADSAERGIPMRLYGITEESKNEIERLFPGEYDFILNRDGGDYIYDIRHLAELGGKKYQQKRNYINRFLHENPQWEIQPITQKNLSECRQLTDEWYQLHEGDIALEKVAISRAFDHYEDLGMDGLALYADKRMIAMTMGSRMRADVFDVNFEKAHADIPGAYQLINREFARYILSKYPEICFMNREEDMGIQGLRKSKLSYHPDEIVKKYSCFVKMEGIS